MTEVWAFVCCFCAVNIVGPALQTNRPLCSSCRGGMWCFYIDRVMGSCCSYVTNTAQRWGGGGIAVRRTNLAVLFD